MYKLLLGVGLCPYCEVQLLVYIYGRNCLTRYSTPQAAGAPLFSCSEPFRYILMSNAELQYGPCISLDYVRGL